MFPVFPLATLLLSPFPDARDTGWSESASPCVDSLLVEAGAENVGGFDGGPGLFGGTDAVEDCDPEEASLFTADRARENPRRRESARAAFTASRTPASEMHTVTRHAAARDGWEDRLELHDDAPARWRLGYAGTGWRVVAGEMTDTALPAWPRALPRRALPAGWAAAHDTRKDPSFLSAPLPSPPLPQGIGAGVVQDRWKAYAMSTWNPVETGAEPPWSKAWNLRHTALGMSVSLPWLASLHLSETRVARAGSDTLSERLIAVGLASPRNAGGNGVGGIADIDLAAALWESETRESDVGWFLAAAFRRGFANGGEANLTLRQRGAAWASAWDPAIAGKDAYGLAEDTTDATLGLRSGAGEVRASGRIPFRENGSARGEAWSVWNPRTGTNRRGMRGALGRRMGDARLELSGTQRLSRAASGTSSVYRLVRADARIESFPRWRVTAWRAWNGGGPLRTGLFVGAEPEWRGLRLAPGYRLEEASDGFEGLATLGARIHRAGLDIEISAALPCAPAPDAGTANWRLTLSTGR